jgi:hypothetical protein
MEKRRHQLMFKPHGGCLLLTLKRRADIGMLQCQFLRPQAIYLGHCSAERARVHALAMVLSVPGKDADEHEAGSWPRPMPRESQRWRHKLTMVIRQASGRWTGMGRAAMEYVM